MTRSVPPSVTLSFAQQAEGDAHGHFIVTLGTSVIDAMLAAEDLPRQADAVGRLTKTKAKGKHDEHTPTRRPYSSPPGGETA